MIRRLALLVVVAAIGCGCAPAPTITERPTSSSSPGATAETSASAPAPSTSAAAGGWEALELPAPEPALGLATTVMTDSADVVVGWGPSGPVAWSSPDGSTWTAEHVPGDMRQPNRAIRWGGRVVIVGAGESGRCAHPFATDSWLRAEDGTWSEAPFQPLFCAGGNAAVAAAGGLAVVVGAGNGDVAFGWSSPDGLHWTDHSAGFPVGLPFEVIATPGEFLAFGVGPDGAWVEGSRDGANWTPPSSLPGPAEARPVGAAVLSDRIVVVLGHPSGAVGLVSSVDGLTWTTEPVPGLVSGELIRVEAIDGGLVAIGGDEEGPTLRVSADGHTWRDVSLPQELTKESSVTDVAVGRGHAILIATRGSEAGTTEPAAWMGPASLLAP